MVIFHSYVKLPEGNELDVDEWIVHEWGTVAQTVWKTSNDSFYGFYTPTQKNRGARPCSDRHFQISGLSGNRCGLCDGRDQRLWSPFVHGDLHSCRLPTLCSHSAVEVGIVCDAGVGRSDFSRHETVYCTGWCPPVVNWFINPMIYSYL